MKRWARWSYGLAVLIAVFVAVSSIVQAVRLSSWTPVLADGWLPAVVVAVWPGSYRRCLSPRR